jgi:hypothetical protein
MSSSLLLLQVLHSGVDWRAGLCNWGMSCVKYLIHFITLTVSLHYVLCINCVRWLCLSVWAFHFQNYFCHTQWKLVWWHYSERCYMVLTLVHMYYPQYRMLKSELISFGPLNPLRWRH